jgi:hypothetical protein
MKIRKMLCAVVMLCASGASAQNTVWDCKDPVSNIKAAGLTLSFKPSSTSREAASGIEIYNCDVNATKGPAVPWSTKAFLSPQFFSTVDFPAMGGRGFSIAVSIGDGGRLTADDSTKEAVTGTVNGGSFEGGTIACDPKPIHVPYMLKFMPWNQFYTLDKGLSKGRILDSVEKTELRSNNVCFIGDINAAEQAISDGIKVKGIVGSDKIDYTFEVTDCAEGSGSYDGWQCTRWQAPKTITASVGNCDKSVPPAADTGDDTWDGPNGTKCHSYYDGWVCK